MEIVDDSIKLLEDIVATAHSSERALEAQISKVDWVLRQKELATLPRESRTPARIAGTLMV